jgi:hypothetical protein
VNGDDGNENDARREVAQNARQFERELIAAKLEAELLDENQGDDFERGYRRGWNARAKSCVEELRMVVQDRGTNGAS